jgi:hypothetical protein
VQLRAHGLKPHAIACDNYFVERENTPKDADGKYNFECLGALDLELFNDHMNRLLKGETVEIPEFNFITGHKEYKGKQPPLWHLGRGDSKKAYTQQPLLQARHALSRHVAAHGASFQSPVQHR